MQVLGMIVVGLGVAYLAIVVAVNVAIRRRWPDQPWPSEAGLW